MRNSIYLLVYGRRFQKSSSSKQNCWPVKPKMLKVIPIPNIVMLDTLFRMKIGLNECLVIHICSKVVSGFLPNLHRLRSVIWNSVIEILIY